MKSDILKIIKKSGKPKSQIAIELMVSRKTLYNWLNGTHEVNSELTKKQIEILKKKYAVK